MSNIPWQASMRLAGFLLGFGELAGWAVSGHPPVSGVMTFAAGLVAMPNAVRAQARRNNHHRDRRRRRR